MNQTDGLCPFCRVSVLTPAESKSQETKSRDNVDIHMQTCAFMPKDELAKLGFVELLSFLKTQTSASDYGYLTDVIEFSQGDVDRLALRAYTTNIYYKRINEALRDEHGVKAWLPYIACLTRALRQLPPLKAATLVFRGIRAQQQRGFQPNEKLTWSSFTSCSLDRKIAQEFAGPSGFVLEMQVQEGAYPIDDPFSAFPEEQEVLLLPFRSFDVISVSQGSQGQKVALQHHIASDDAPFVFKPTVLWVDSRFVDVDSKTANDMPDGLDQITAQLDKDHARLIPCRNTESALRYITNHAKDQPFDRFRIMTNFVRDGHFSAGIDFVRALRDKSTVHYQHPVCLYGESFSVSHAALADLGPFLITSRPVDAFAFATCDMARLKTLGVIV